MVSSLLRECGQKHSHHRWYFGPLRAPLAPPAPYHSQRQRHQSTNSSLMAISGLICEDRGRSGAMQRGNEADAVLDYPQRLAAGLVWQL